MVRVFYLAVLVHLLSCAPVDKRESDDNKFRNKISQDAVDAGFSGAILISFNNNVLVDTAFGFSDQAKKTKITGKTIFPVASITKLFVRHAIFILIDRGMISFDDKLSKFGIDIRLSDSIRISDLIYHTSGLPDIHNEMPVFNNPWMLTGEVTTDDLLRMINSYSSLHFKPGTRVQYSNSNYILLGKVIERVSNKELDVFLTENIFEPYGMNNTGLYKEHSKIEGHAEGFFIRNRAVTYLPDFNFRNFWGSGNAYSTAYDLYRYMDCIKKRLPVKYSEQLLQHTGSYPGYRTLIKSVPEIGFSAIVLSNNGNSDPGAILAGAETYISELLGKQQHGSPAKHYSGQYSGNRLNENVKIVISIEKGQLYLNGIRTIQISPYQFLLPENDFAVITFYSEEPGNLKGFRINDNGSVTRFYKL